MCGTFTVYVLKSIQGCYRSDTSSLPRRNTPGASEAFAQAVMPFHSRSRRAHWNSGPVLLCAVVCEGDGSIAETLSQSVGKPKMFGIRIRSKRATKPWPQ